MKKITISLFSALFLMLSFTNTILYSIAEDIVFICNSENAYRYHNDKECRGLNRCTHEIVGISEVCAKKLKRTRCKICY